MRSRTAALLLALAACARPKVEPPIDAARAAPAKATPTPREPAEAPWDPAPFASLVALADTAWTLETWPGRDRATCAPRGSADVVDGYPDSWCDRCTIDDGPRRATYGFYPDVEAGTCTLQQAEIGLGVGTDRLPEVVAWMDARRGASEEAGSDDVKHADSWQWLSVRRWRSAHEVSFVAFDPASHAGGMRSPSVLMLLRRDPLLGLDEEHANWDADALTEEDWRDRGAQACHDAALPSCDVALAALDRHDQEAYIAAFHDALDRFEAIDRASPRAVALMYWLDYMAGDQAGLLLSANEPERALLAARGVTFSDGQDSLLLDATWLRDAAEIRPRSQWGQEARFKLLVRESFDSENDPADFVIACGEELLREKLPASLDADVRFQLARAYETGWSLARATKEEVDPETIDHWKVHAAWARRHALELYRARNPRDEHERIWLAQRIFRLAHDIDTGQRWYTWSGC